MAARCASCSYPLSVSDSVSCCECLSYFHIDCAQLVGFPYYELSSDPIRNTFHCQTCKILPLPRQSDSFSDSDSDGDCTMPSRQLDYHMEGQPDFSKDMNEIKGSVQDLSELCKDMFREINELKSINLTLRCCVENLRHDGEQRDNLLAELKKRVEVLEGKGVESLINSIDKSNMYVERISIEDAERYLTPDPEYSRLKEMESLEQGSFHNDRNQVSDETQNFIFPNVESYFLTEDKSNKTEKNNSWESSKSEIYIQEKPRTIDTECTENETSFEEKEHNPKDETVHFAEEEIISTTVNKTNTETCPTGSVKDWDWRGSKAIQLKDAEDKNESSAEEEEENDVSDNENNEAQGWEILDEDLKSKLVTKDYEKKTSKTMENVEESEEEDDEEETEEEAEEIRETWADEVEKYDKEEDSLISGEEAEETIQKSDDKYLAEIYQPRIISNVILQAEETEEHNEEAVEEGDKISLKAEERVETPKPEMIDVEIIEGSGGPELEGMVKPEEGSRLAGDRDVAAEGAAPEGDATEGGQSPEAQGEVQPSEPLEESEPPPPPQPHHSPDDLWDYLKETVTGEHPTTVEEFVQKLIGTLEHVPEEYLTPVIDYNIKRATSPSVTDGEHLDAKDHVEGEGLEHTELGEVRPQENGEVALEGDQTTFAPEGGSSVTERDGFPAEESGAHTTDIPEESSQSAEGYSAVEAPA